MSLLTLWKFRDVAYLVAILAMYAWAQGLSLKIAGWELKIANARIEAQERADRLANELIIQQAIAIGATNQKATNYGNQIKKATSDKERDTIGSRAVRDIVLDSDGARKPNP